MEELVCNEYRALLNQRRRVIPVVGESLKYYFLYISSLSFQVSNQFYHLALRELRETWERLVVTDSSLIFVVICGFFLFVYFRQCLTASLWLA